MRRSISMALAASAKPPCSVNMRASPPPGGRPVISLDGREIDPTPTGFLLALSQSLGLQHVDFDAVIANWPPAGLLLIDRYELLIALDSWLRETFLPELPAQSLVVMASRPPPASSWRADIDWADLTRILPLRDLLPDESQRYLSARGIPDDQHAAILAFTHGHPLALTLVADVLSRDGAPQTLARVFIAHIRHYLSRSRMWCGRCWSG